MTDETKAIADAALALPAVERAALTDQLLRSLDKPDEEIDAKWAAEAEVRIDAIDRGDMALHDADQVLKDLRALVERK